MKESLETPLVVPILAHWDITYGCNFRCSFCLSSSGQRAATEFSTEEAIALIDKLHDAGILYLRVLGGEPFFRMDTPKIFCHAAEKMILSFSTNATMITDEVAEALSSIRDSIRYLQVSLYGPDRETYGRVTGNPRGFDRALEGLKLLVDKDLDVSILVVATEDNVHRLQDYFNIARDYGVEEFRITPKAALGRAAPQAGSEEIGCPKFWTQLIGQLQRLQANGAEDDPWIRVQARPLFGCYLSKQTGIGYFYQNCNAGTSMIYINPSGKAAPCPFLLHMPKRLRDLYSHIGMQDLRSTPFDEVWHSEPFEAFRKYYEPSNNLFNIDQTCKFYQDGECIPCTVTPCNCRSLIRAVREETGQVEPLAQMSL